MRTQFPKSLLWVGLVLILTAQQAIARGPLTFEERVSAQEAVERVYYAKRIWPKENPQPKPPFEQMVQRAQIKAKVTDYLKQSAALGQFWQRPITSEQLQAEMDRMAANTKDSDGLKEIFATLGNDPYLIAECLARPALAERELDDWYSFDTRFHAEAKAQAEKAQQELTPATLRSSVGGEYQRVRFVLENQSPDAPHAEPQKDVVLIPVGAEEFEKLRVEFTRTPKPLSFKETHDAFVISALIEDNGDSLVLDRRFYSKLSQGNWWQSASAAISPVMDLQNFEYRLPATANKAKMPEASCYSGWTATLGLDFLTARSGHTAVWTGTEMIIWGGDELNTGGRYNPLTDTWLPTSTGADCPWGRPGHTAIWTGTEMIVWGGRDFPSRSAYRDGSRYNPVTNTWIYISPDIPNVPAGRENHTAVWTGTEMIVWGGWNFWAGGWEGPRFNTGGRYNPATNTWFPTSMGSNCPIPRQSHTAIWTGSEMIVWGGRISYWTYTNTGAIYNPGLDAWLPVSGGANCPTPRQLHIAVWTGSEMIVWGGETAAGGRYNPATGTWATVSTVNAPPYSYPNGIWTGTEMLVWGAASSTNYGGGRYTPQDDTWNTMSTGPNNPRNDGFGAGVWTGTEWIVWGGGSNKGARYNPTSNSWLPTSYLPEGRRFHTTVWDGTEMILWGGMGSNTGYLNTMGVYDPIQDRMRSGPLGDVFVPAARSLHSAVWTGSDMIAWGGENGAYLNSGGRYNPIANKWFSTSAGTGCPTERSLHTALWDGTEMLVWGGVTTGKACLNDGGKYDPSGEAWSMIPATGESPTARARHSAVWTGAEMVIWGGHYFEGTDWLALNTGGRFVPGTGGWQSTATTNAPTARHSHTAVWAGDQMVVWGGYDGAHANTGGRYVPATDIWTPTSTGSNVPTGRVSHTAVWTGAEMLVWGGYGFSDGVMFDYLNTGARYSLSGDTWVPITAAGAPTKRRDHTAVWTGTQMVVWGGFDGEGWLDTGGQYSFDAAPPTGLSAPILEDPVVCSTGVAVHWDADPTRWNDSGDTASRNYRVFRNGVALASGGCSGPLAYGTTSCLDDSTTPMQAYTYTVAYNNACGFSAQTPAAGITDIGFVTPVISGPNPACLPGTLTTGAYPSYQWKLDGMPISGANGSSLFATLEGTYTVEVTDGNGCSGNSAPYQFYDPPVPTVEGLSTSCTSVSLSTQPFAHYQWRRNSSDITGANAQSYSAFASGSYAVRVTDLNGCEGTSVAKAVTIHPDPEPSISPATQTICQTLTASFSVTHNGTGAIYTWRKDGIDLVDGPHHSGTATATLTILDATAAESGSYTCFVDLGSCAQESPAGTLVVKPCSSPTLTAEPAFTQDTSNALSWGAISEAMGYEVQASTDSFATTSQTSGTIPGLAHTFTGLVTDITYQYRVKAIFTYGESLWSALQVSTQDALPPASAISTPLAGAILYGPLADLSGTASDATSGVASVAVSWDGGTNWYPATGTTAWAFTWTLPLDGPYTLLSRATDGVDNVEAPTGVAVTVRNRPLAATGVTVTDVPYDGGGVLDITWTLSADDGAGLNYVAGYSVWRASAALGPFTQIGSVPAGQTFYEDGSAGTGANRYYKVRAYTGYDVLYNWTDSAVVGPTMATNEPPLPVNNLQADLTSGCNVRLTWVESPSPDILLYNIYYDAGTGTVNFTTPFATVMAPAATWVSSGLALDTRYIFSVRAKDLAGQEDGLTANRVSIVTHCDLNIVRAEIKHPQAGRTLQGNQITVNADLIQGTRAEVSSVRLQYRTSGSGPWTDIVGFPGEPNPVTTWPYLIHWDVTALADGDYDLRAVASDLTPAPDPYPPFVTVTVLTGNGSRSSSSTTAKIIEQSVGSDHQASVESYRGSGNLNATAFIQDQNLMQVSIPKGNLPQTIDRIILQDLSPSNFAKAKPHGVVRSPKGVLDLGSSLVAANIYRSVILQGGKTSFGGGGADLVFFVKDENNDHIVDGTTIPLNDLDVFLDEGSGSWSLQRTNRTVDLVNKFIRVTVAQVGTYGLFSYPKPATVQGLILERSGDDVVLTWQPVSMDEKGTPITIDHYNVYYGSTPNFIADIVNWTNVLPEANKGDTTITDVNPPSPRYYLVTAIDTTGKESYPSEHIGP